MKKLVLFAIGAAMLSLSACNHKTCPAYSSAKSATPTITASTATPTARQ